METNSSGVHSLLPLARIINMEEQIKQKVSKTSTLTRKESSLVKIIAGTFTFL
jgi:hypothetical protein